MESFVRVVRAGSFTVGASQLGLSRALVSRHISDLETHLGVRLLNRSTRSLALTEEGTAYLEFCEKLFREIETSERAILRTHIEPAGTLKVLAPKSFGAMHLSDAVIGFARAQPRLRVSLMLENTPYRGSYDFAERDLDVVLCFSTLRGASVVEEKIVTLDWALCASPDYLARAGEPNEPAALGTHACLVHVHVSPNDAVWRLTGPDGQYPVKVRAAFSSDSAFTLRKAAIADLGITMIPRYAVADDLASGALVTVLPGYKIAPRPLLAVYPKALVTPAKVQAFVAYLKDWMVERNFDGA